MGPLAYYTFRKGNVVGLGSRKEQNWSRDYKGKALFLREERNLIGFWSTKEQVGLGNQRKRIGLGSTKGNHYSQKIREIELFFFSTNEQDGLGITKEQVGLGSTKKLVGLGSTKEQVGSGSAKEGSSKIGLRSKEKSEN